MSETQKTLVFLLAAAFLGLSAFLTTPVRVTPDAFLDQGEPFFPEFTDPNVAATLEVIEFDEETASARPFQVTVQDGKWSIPSHHNYPADGKERLSQTAAAIIEARKEDFRSSNVTDHEALGVLDPLDETLATLRGRGKRVTIRGEGGRLLADLIIGKELEDREEFHYVRVPDQKRVYVASIGTDLSTRFEDWIERDLLEVNQGDLQKLILRNYSVDEETGSVSRRDTLTLEKRDGEWTADRMASDEELDSARMSSLLSAIDNLSIVGVRPKPEGLSRTLRREEGAAISQADVLSLQTRGYYFSGDGRLLSNEGELEVFSSTGIQYMLRFGEIVYGAGESVTAGTGSSGDEQSGPGENRYLFITAVLDAGRLPEPPKPAGTEFLNKPEEEWTEADNRNKEAKDLHDQWAERLQNARERSESLNARFADWYYVISAGSFDQVHLSRSDLIKKQE